MTRKSNKRYRNRRYVNFHRDWKRLAREREQRIQHHLNDISQLENESTSVSRNEDETNQRVIPFREKLKSWAIQNRISMRALDSLLSILKSNGHNELPKSYRTLLNTPRDIELRTFSDSKYWYRGLTECLTAAFSNLNRNLTIKLKFNIDGLPIFGSSQIQFWPILCSVEGKLNELIVGKSVIFIQIVELYFIV